MTGSSGNALVVGSEGYLGRHVAQALERSGHRVTRADAFPVKATTRTWDITNPAHTPDDLGDFDTLYFFAGLTGTGVSFTRYEEFIRANEWGLIHTLNALCALPRPPRIVFPSTRLVYRGQPRVALSEDAPKETLTPYAATKLSAERFLAMYQDLHQLPYTVFRICVPYGDVTDSTAGSYGTLRHFLEPAKAGKPITLYGDGSQQRSLIHAEDLAQNLVRASCSPDTLNQIFNLGGPDVLSIRAIADQVAEKFGVPVTSVPWPEEAWKLESGDTIFSDARLASKIELRFQHRFADWIAAQ